MTQSENELPLVEDIMTTPAQSVTLNHTVTQVLKMTKKYNVSGFPVVDSSNVPIGIVSSLDLMTEIAIGKLHLKLGELPLSIRVDKEIITLKIGAPIKEALLAIIRNRIGRVIITDENNQLCGVVSRKDLVHHYINVNQIE
jgi:transcriptional regulator